MKKLPLGLALCLSCAAPAKAPPAAPAPPVAPAKGVTVSLVGTSDLHGHVEARRFTVAGPGGDATVERGGLALLGGYVNILRARGPVLLLDGGDLFQGTLTSNLGEGRAVIEAYNALGYTASTVGNHEFDYGPAGPRAVPMAGSNDDPTGALKQRISEARFPFLSANLLDGASGEGVKWPNLAPSLMYEVPGHPGLRIGLVGGTAEDTPHTTNADNLVGLRIGKVVEATKAQAAALRSAGAAAVVLVVHEGGNCKSFADPHDLSSCVDPEQRVLGMAKALAGDVDAIIAGHSHAGVAHFVGKVAVVQSFMGGRAFGRIDLRFRQEGGRFTLQPDATRVHPPQEVCSVAVDKGALCDKDALAGKALSPATYEGQPVVPDQKVAEVLAPHIDRGDKQRLAKIGVVAPERIRRNYRAESSLGTLLADLIRAGAQMAAKQKIDVAFQNGGGIRAELPQGELTYGDVYEVLPFDNRLAVMRISGALLAELVRYNLTGSGGVLLPSGISIEASCKGAELQVKLSDERGRPLEERRVYSVAVSDFLASGGDNFGRIKDRLDKGAVTYFDEAPPLREIVLVAMKRRPTLALDKGARPRLVLPMARPVRCGGSPQAGDADRQGDRQGGDKKSAPE